MGLLYLAVCLFTPQFLLVLIASTYGGMARLSAGIYLDGLPACRQSHIQVLTGPGME